MATYDEDGAGLESIDDIAGIGQKSSAFSNKVSAILSTPFADSDLRDALKILDERRIQNVAETRRRLRLDIQKEVIDCNGDIIKDFGRVVDQLRQVGTTVDSLSSCFEAMKIDVSAAGRESGPMLEEASTLMAHKREAETKKQLYDAFHKHFILSEEETQKLVSLSEGVDDDFFKLLARLKQIHGDCQVLLGGEHQQLGLELMEQSSRTLNSTFQKLYKWIEGQFKTLELENPHMSAPVRRALRALAERPTIFEACLGTLATAREKNLSDAFYSALSGASTQTSDTTAKPMEFYAHDPIRFIGDMLAWTHSAAVSEREALEILFVSEGDEMARGLRAGAESEPWLREGVQAFDGKKALELLVNRDLAGVARGLRQRVELVIQSDDEPVLAYKIANLFDFYKTTLGRLLGSSSVVVETLTNLQQLALKQYQTTMKDYISSILVDTSRPPSDLGPPEFLMDALAQLEELMKSFESSLPQSDFEGAAFRPVMKECLDPVFKICEQMSHKLDQNSRAIFIINCIDATKLVLAPHQFTAAKVDEFDRSLEDLSAQLMEFQHSFFLQRSGVQILLSALAPLTDAEEDLKIIPTLDPFHPPALSESSQVLDDFLPSAFMDAQENISALRQRQLAERITSEAAVRFCEDFEVVESKLTAADELFARNEAKKNRGAMPDDGPSDPNSGDGSNNYIPLRSKYPRTSVEIRVLLS